MTSPPTSVTLVSECLIKPLHDLSPDEAKHEPLYFTPFELTGLNFRYSQQGLLFTKPKNNNKDDFSITVFLNELKHSLSATLTHFYPLAARLATRILDNPPSYVIYLDPENSPGVKFVYAKTDATISDIINPTYVPSIVHSFFDLNNAINHDGHTLPLLSIKVTELTDGIFIGGSINHLIADGTSFWHFMSSWSEIFFKSKLNHPHQNSNCDIIMISRPPIFKRQPLQAGSSDLFINLPYTHRDQFIQPSAQNSQMLVVKERFFKFSSASVARLKKKANDELSNNNNTTQKEMIISSLQAVSAVLWRCITKVRRLANDSETVCVLVVNNRPRMNPPLSDDYFGSPLHGVSGTATVEELMANGLGWAALKLHETIANYDDVAVKNWVESWVRNPVVYERSDKLSPFSNLVLISNSPRFDMYGCEFGLGKAIAARSGAVTKLDGAMTMYPGREGGGSIDVQVCLIPETMKDLECDEEFISSFS
uniref:uncharacterized acetyltransferase At3g50280-like n=1 Tax=Erigeron canadensis TaxID=72917 RepID=UPI001CB965F0|nr:uncharacterized acetyltransferase At3g50280-like [Erigeron canadensis]